MKSDGGGEAPVHLPVDFDGPICANCVHRRIPKNTDSHRDWQCLGGERRVRLPAERCPITGEVHDVQYASPLRCVDRNKRGDCELFEAEAGSGVTP